MFLDFGTDTGRPITKYQKPRMNIVMIMPI